MQAQATEYKKIPDQKVWNFLWLPLHHSLSDQTLEYQIDSHYLKDLGSRLGLQRPMLLKSIN
jgi:hypothetical protein